MTRMKSPATHAPVKEDISVLSPLAGQTFVYTADTPLSRCLSVLQQGTQMIRQDLIEAAELSQPTITRAVTTLIESRLVRERPDLIVPRGPGRPRIPIELSPSPWLHAAIAIDPTGFHMALYGTRADLVVEQSITMDPATTNPAHFVDTMIAELRTLVAEHALPLAAIGIMIPARVMRGTVTNAEWYWRDVDILHPFTEAFAVPVDVEDLATGTVLAQYLDRGACLAQTKSPHQVAVLAAGDTVGAAWTSTHGVSGATRLPIPDSELLGFGGCESPTESEIHVCDAHEALSTRGFLAAAGRQGIKTATVSGMVDLANSDDERAESARRLLDERARLLGSIASTMASGLDVTTVIVTGCAFSHDPRAVEIVRSTLREAGHSHEVVYCDNLQGTYTSAARAIAVRPLFTDPTLISERLFPKRRITTTRRRPRRRRQSS